jgi:site-specific DNA-methyltransferase (adenine-specific)
LHYVKGGTNSKKTGLQQIYSNKACFRPIKDWYLSELERLGITEKEIAAKYTQVTGKKPHMLRHYFRDNQFAIPSEAIYESVYVPLGFRRPHAELRDQHKDLLGEYADLRQQYDSLRYTHHCDAEHRNVFCIKPLGSADSQRIHITQKPQELIQRLIRVSSDTGDVVLDPFMGSRTTAVAALAEGRKFIGFEMDEGYYKAAVERIKKVKDCPYTKRGLETDMEAL